MPKPNLILRALLIPCFLCCFVACDGQWWNNVPGMGGYWWTRGQPRSPEKQLVLAEERLTESLAKNATGRGDVTPAFKEMTGMLDTILSDINKNKPADQIALNLQTLEQKYLGVSGKLSIGSRPAFAELSSQLRAMVVSYESDAPPSPEAATLYVARTKMLLANELAMPAPVLQ